MGNGTDKLKNHRSRDILAYCQNFLGQMERAELEAHMRECGACQRALKMVPRFLVALNEALRLNEPSAAELLARVKAEMSRKAARRARLRSRIRLAAALSALVVLGTGAIFAVT